MSLYRPSFTIPPFQPQPLQRQIGQSGASTPVSGTIAANLPSLQVAAAGWQSVSGTIAANLPALQISASGTGTSLPSNYYTTTFPATENPMSEGGVWTNGGTDGLDWTDNRTTTNKQFGTQTGTNTNTSIGVTPSKYDDSMSVLRGTFGADQVAKATVFSTVASGLGTTTGTEVELLLRASISAHSATGYEVEFSTNPDNGYFDFVRWNGQVADFTPLLHLAPGDTQAGAGMACRTVVAGDELTATIVGNKLSAYVNGVLLATITDSTWTTGNPGIGHYLHNGSTTGDVTTYGFSQFTASTMPSGTIAANLPSFTIVSTGTETFSGGIAANLPSLQIAASGVAANNFGSIAANLPSLTIAAVATESFIATISAQFPTLVVRVAGHVNNGTIIHNMGPPNSFNPGTPGVVPALAIAAVPIIPPYDL